MGQNAAKELEANPDVKFMLTHHPDSCKYLKKWVTKYDFKPKLRDPESFCNVRQNLMEKRKVKLLRKKNTKSVEVQLKAISKWIEQSKKRVEDVKAKEAKKVYKMEVRKDEETGVRMKKGSDSVDCQSPTDRNQGSQSTTPREEELSDEAGNTTPRPSAFPATPGSAQRPPAAGTREQKKKRACVDHSPPAEGHLDTLYPPLPQTEAYPMVAVANPAFGMDDADGRPHEPTIMVYRPWTTDECKAACQSLPPIDVDVDKFIQSVYDLMNSYHLNGKEFDTCMRLALGYKYGRIRGHYNPYDATGQPLAADSADLVHAIRLMFDEARKVFKKQPDCTKIRLCRQEDNESARQYIDRLSGVHRLYCGLPEDDANDSPYQILLKNAFLDGIHEATRRFVFKHYIGWRTAPLNTLVEYATHAEELQKKKKERTSTTAMTAMMEGLSTMASAPVFYQSQDRGRGRGRFNNQHRDQRKKRFNNRDDLCYNCGKPGHFARECRQPRRPREESHQNDM